MLQCNVIQYKHQRETVIDKHVKTQAPKDRQHLLGIESESVDKE